MTTGPIREIKPKRSALLAELEKKLLVSFENISLLDQALTHSSYTHDNKEAADYERLEFFGDAVLKFIVSEYLVQTYEAYDEGRLTEIRAVLVNGKTLQVVAESFELQRYILAGFGIAIKPSMLGRSMEAILGAIYLDRGMSEAKRFIDAHFCSKAEAVDQDRVKENYKAQLQQMTQARAQGLPKYTVLAVEGPPHDPLFTVSVSVEEKAIAEAKGQSKKSAEQEAAKLAYAILSSADNVS